MTKAKRDLTLPDPSTLDLQSLLGPPPLIEGEDPAAYEALAGRIRAAVEPRDVIEEIWVRDISDNLWETLRLRRLKAKLLHASAHNGLRVLLGPLISYHALNDTVEQWAQGDGKTRKFVTATLKNAGLDEEAIYAQTFAVRLDTFEKIDRMIMQTEARRNMVLREVDRHRDVIARRLREVAMEIEDAQFEVIESDGAAK